ncbi:cytotoxic translational repressor of toxin-antitoxin stability system [Trichocoleus sp. FACHB-90]|uniref:cytotoxic translational repressor of toxin-antitoxin stability system n=1 Tax=Cyanophyceae TaxID=3028117 RepID=UPI001685ED88|nr:cytotoxic translational repressor of toxin-antitoxin stability system [Trichocoleus sp. FACHB-90]MBD1836481.1 cytotoxic translational repressor of toxin-antitoxin stability system [Cyanobacteria bacterium FACHB-472]MBD1928581.1 cytotoxic translational repressor of toxin-antitoxin stability system [Trichocoleus sp. FACHB-90]
MKLEVRYARSFLRDLKNLEYAARERIYEFVFEEFLRVNQIYDLPELQRLGSDTIFYRFSIDDYLIAIEVTGHIVKFLRVLPKPDL